MLIPRHALERVGLLDEALFAYAEDVDWSLRARAAGLRILVVPASVVHHRVSAATGGAASPDSLYYALRNGLVVAERAAEVGRVGAVRRRAEGTVWFAFADLCGGPRSQADYIEIARTHHSVFISGVPQFDPSRDDEARRFISLVDEFYDRGVKLVVTADAPPAELYQGERLAFEFARTASRLAEMQTHAYLERPHRP